LLVLGRFPFNQKIRNFLNRGKRYGNFLEKFPDIPKGKPNETEISGQKFQKISVYLARLSYFPELPEDDK